VAGAGWTHGARREAIAVVAGLALAIGVRDGVDNFGQCSVNTRHVGCVSSKMLLARRAHERF
jgi:hypothetical protein